MEAAIGQGDSDGLRRALVEARHLGFSREELTRMEAELHNLQHSDVGRELREAINSGNADRLRQLASTAAAAGVAPDEVAQAWERLRQLEAHTWLKRELQEAVARGDVGRLRAAVKQAEASRLACPELDAARGDLEKQLERAKAKQELQLARSGGNFYSIQAGIRECERIGVSREEVAAAMGQASSGAAFAESAAASVTQIVVPATHLSSVCTNPQLASVPQTYCESVGTNPQFSSFATVATDPHLMSMASFAMSAMTDPQLGASFADGFSMTASGPRTMLQPGLLQNQLTSRPLMQPRPDEPPASMYDLGSMVDFLPSPEYTKTEYASLLRM